MEHFYAVGARYLKHVPDHVALEYGALQLDEVVRDEQHDKLYFS